MPNSGGLVGNGHRRNNSTTLSQASSTIKNRDRMLKIKGHM